MTTYTVALGFDGSQIDTVDAETALDAAAKAHTTFLRNAKRDSWGWAYEEHGPMWGTPARRSAGNGAQSLDDCLLVYAGSYADDYSFDVSDRDRDDLRAIVRAIEPTE